ncbi:MAG: histidinol-phosphatase HisJ family protein [Epulopiscium sp.]|nr:histidinol-phosphatase HisJ family protein [Candidatus Epulonipiscium sp.]
MFFADYHSHTYFSSDSNASMEDMIQTGINLGLKQLAFTDHVDFDYPNSDYTFEIDYNEYLKQFKQYKLKYKNKIDLIFGVEIGLQPHLQEKISDFITHYPFDFIIGSSHVVHKLDLYNGDFFQGKEQKNAYLQYFEEVLKNIHIFNDFQVYGHLDYIIRYGNYKNPVLSYEDYQNIIDEILKNLIHKGQGIELNTSGYRYGLNQFHPQTSILKSYKQLGGEIITVGSDAHYPQDLCANFKEAYEILKEIGFSYITIFKNQKPDFIPIP